MKPIAIFRHSATEGPGYFATYLDLQGFPWRLIRLDAAEVVPAVPEEFSGICLMGGPMSVNDDLPWIGDIVSLIRGAMAKAVPVIGHCLGGQLMAKAMGAAVSRNPVKEIGWGPVRVEDSAEARRWLGGLRNFDAFHWHGETFDIPEGAARIVSGRWCANQAFASGPHLGLQCHVEMTPELIRRWCAAWDKEVRGKAGPSIQTPEQMLEDIESRCRALHCVADALYARWMAGLKG